MNGDFEVLNNLKIGIVGCGHLGQAIAQMLVRGGLEKTNLLISYGGNPLTYQKLKEQGLDICLAENQKVFEKAGIVLITVRPQDITGLKASLVTGRALIVSCMAGVPLELIQRILGANVYRMMFSGPDTIVSGKGVAAMYPEHEHLKLMLNMLNLLQIKTATESDMDIFTVGVCMTAALLKAENTVETKNAVEKIKDQYPLFSELYAWAVTALPDIQSETEREIYVSRMITKGGVTDAVIKSLANGETFDAALIKGISRTKEISAEIRQQLENSL